MLFAKRFYREIGYWGIIQIDLTFDEIKGRRLFVDNGRSNFKTQDFDNDISIKRKTTVSNLSDNLAETAIDICREFLRSFGVRNPDCFILKNQIEKLIEEHKSL